jgi:mannose/fructose-specific phosphotransferase system component IIA
LSLQSGILVVTHGRYGEELIKTAVGLFGPQERCESLSLEPGMGREDLASAIAQKLAELGPSIIFVDMLGGTPWNASLLQGLPEGCEVLAGVSLPLLLEAFSQRGQRSPKELGQLLLEHLPGTVECASRILRDKAA